MAELDVAAASGLVEAHGTLYVVADDETSLARYGLDGTPRERIRLLAAPLPEAHAERKRRKPDFEALCVLPDGRLLVLGSGSTPTRRRGALVDAERAHAVRAVDLAPLYVALERQVPELNVEGAVVVGERLVLLQRGNGRARFDACIELDLSRTLASLDAEARLAPDALRSVRRVALGSLAGVPLSLTDAAPHPSGAIVFTAAAEDTRNPYLDGVCAGAVVGVLADGAVRSARAVVPACKLEGVALRTGAQREPELWLVSDADDRRVPATLYRAPLPP